jgi:hypothetical protein
MNEEMQEELSVEEVNKQRKINKQPQRGEWKQNVVIIWRSCHMATNANC